MRRRLCPYWSKKDTGAEYSQRCPLGLRCPYSHGAKEMVKPGQHTIVMRIHKVQGEVVTFQVFLSEPCKHWPFVQEPMPRVVLGHEHPKKVILGSKNILWYKTIILVLLVLPLLLVQPSFNPLVLWSSSPLVPCILQPSAPSAIYFRFAQRQSREKPCLLPLSVLD